MKKYKVQKERIYTGLKDKNFPSLHSKSDSEKKVAYYSRKRK
jgi:hypothetical protein